MNRGESMEGIEVLNWHDCQGRGRKFPSILHIYSFSTIDTPGQAQARQRQNGIVGPETRRAQMRVITVLRSSTFQRSCYLFSMARVNLVSTEMASRGHGRHRRRRRREEEESLWLWNKGIVEAMRAERASSGYEGGSTAREIGRETVWLDRSVHRGSRWPDIELTNYSNR